MAVYSLWEDRALALPGPTAGLPRSYCFCSARIDAGRRRELSVRVLGADGSGVFPKAAVLFLILRQARRATFLCWNAPNFREG